MREILFRGQRIDNGEWVYGMPLESKFGCTYMLTKQGGLNADFIYSRYTILDKKDSIPIISESIGQFTGLLDKNGNKIFENDRVLYDGVLGNVFYNKDLAMFMVRFDYINSVYNFDNLDRELEIIGNIHEENK